MLEIWKKKCGLSEVIVKNGGGRMRIICVGKALYVFGLLSSPFILHLAKVSLYLVTQFLPSLTQTGWVWIAEQRTVSFIFLVQQTKDVMLLIVEPVLMLFRKEAKGLRG